MGPEPGNNFEVKMETPIPGADKCSEKYCNFRSSDAAKLESHERLRHPLKWNLSRKID